MLKSLALAALLAAQSAAQPAASPPQRCLPKAMVGDAAMVLAPYAIDALARHCEAHLPRTAFLVAGAPALVQRLRTDSAGRMTSAAEAMRAVMGGDMPPVRDEAALVTVMAEMMSGLLAKDLPAANCGEVSSIVESLAPLPTANIGRFASSVAAIVGRPKAEPATPGKKAGAGGLTICQDG